MTFHLEQPTEKISKRAITVWRIHHFLKNSIALLILFTLLLVYDKFLPFSWIGILIYVMIVAVIIMMIYDLTIHPIYLQRTWRYRIDEHVIQLKFGFFNKQHIVIPISRVEYVNTHQGPLLRKYKLSAMTIGTIASQHEIPALEEEDAKNLRHKIVSLARLEQEEQNDDVIREDKEEAVDDRDT